MEKKISDMTKKEILRRQLELIAEDSEKATAFDLQGLTSAMILVLEKLGDY